MSLPSGFRQSLLQVANQIDTFLTDLGTIAALITQAKALFTALDAIVGHPEQLPDLLSNPGRAEDPAASGAGGDGAAAHDHRHASGLLDGAPRKAVLDAIDVVQQVLDAAADAAPTSSRC